MRFLLSEEWRGPGGPPFLGSLRRDWRGTLMGVLSSPPLERPRGKWRSSSLQFPPTDFATVVETHHHRRIGRVDEGDALLLAVPPHCAKSWPFSHLSSRTTSPKNILYHSQVMEATPPQKPASSRPQKVPMSQPSARQPMAGHHRNHQGAF